MIYLSAQPAEYYFMWQLEVQLQNFEDIGIVPENIHVVLSYKPEEGIPSYFEVFVETNKQAYFFFYPDNRIEPKYLSSIRPHILKQHFTQFPELANRIVCYHDSDILFRERLNERLLSETEYWYFSDTRNYVGGSYLKRFGDDFFRNLCKDICIDPQLVEQNEAHSGGAQHIMKGVTAEYWEQVEQDSEKIYAFIKDYNSKLKNNAKQAQAWCADMWAVLWNAWKLNKKVRLHNELLFSWPKDHISRFYNTKIFHNSGVYDVENKDYFCKLLFKKSSPYDVDFSSIKQDHCSIKFVEQIQRLADKQPKEKIPNCTLLITVQTVTLYKQQRIIQYINYIYKHLDIKVHLVELGPWPSFNRKLVGRKASYTLWKEDDIGTFIKRRVKTDYFIYTDASILIPLDNILATIEILIKDENTLAFPADEVVEMSVFQYNLFKDTLAQGLEKKNNSKQSNTLDYVECFAMSTSDFTRSGGNNTAWHYFYEDGFNLERQVRCRFLGYSIRKVELPAFKLFPNDHRQIQEQKNSAEKYLEICEDSIDHLRREIAYGDYTFNKPFKRRKNSAKYSVGIASLREGVDPGLLQQYLEVRVTNPLAEIRIVHQDEMSENLKSIVRHAKQDKLDFLLLLSEDLLIENQKDALSFWEAVEAMDYYGLQILSALHGGGFKQEKKLTNSLFWIDTLPHSSLLVIHKSLFDKILDCDFRPDKPLEFNLNQLTKHVGTITPFIGLPKPLHLLDEKYMLRYHDRTNYIKRIEDKLKWISDHCCY